MTTTWTGNIRVKPWGTNTTEWQLVVKAAQQLIGHSIARVTYLLPTSSSEEESPPVHLDGIDWVSPVGMGIELETTSGGIFSALWVMEGRMTDTGAWMASGLALDRGSAAERHGWDLLPIDVSAADNWNTLLGKTIEHVNLSWETIDMEGAAGAWSARIDFREAESVVIALGDFVYPWEGEVTWAPDGLVVIFDSSIAKNLSFRCSYQSAYGSKRVTEPDPSVREEMRAVGNPPDAAEQLELARRC